MRGLVLAFLFPLWLVADWPQWRGPNRDGVVDVAEPKSWPEKLRLAWKIQMGEGHSSPILAGGKIYLHTRQGEKEVVSALDPGSGKVLWQQSYPAPYDVNPSAASHGKGVKSTPVVSDGRVFTFGINGILSCFDAATGKPRWRQDFSSRFKKTSPAFGTAMSPVVDRGLLIAHVGGDGQGALTAFDAATGAAKWSWKGDGPAYASPIVVELYGVRQVVTQSQKNIVSVAAATGDLLWKMPFTTPYEQNSVTPALHEEMLIFSGLDDGIMGVKAAKDANQWTTEKRWHNRTVSMYMNSPVVAGDLMFGFSHRNKGQLFCLDPRTGSTLWSAGGREGDNAAMVSAGSAVLALISDGRLIVFKKSSKAFEPVRRYTVAESPTWAHPLLLDRAIVIKDASTLARWNLE